MTRNTIAGILFCNRNSHLALFMAFASIHVPDFSIQAVVRAESCARATARAIALVEGMPAARTRGGRKRSRRASGNRSGHGQIASRAIPLRCKSVRVRASQEQSAHAALLDLGWSISPRVEDTAADTIVVDLAGLASLFGSEETIAHLLAQRASDLGLIAHVAVASANLEVAMHAARGFPGITVIPPGRGS